MGRLLAPSRGRPARRRQVLAARGPQTTGRVTLRKQISNPVGDQEVAPHHELSHHRRVVFDLFDLLESLTGETVRILSIVGEMIGWCDLHVPLSGQAHETMKKAGVPPVRRL